MWTHEAMLSLTKHLMQAAKALTLVTVKRTSTQLKSETQIHKTLLSRIQTYIPDSLAVFGSNEYQVENYTINYRAKKSR
jgi:hypothetical protein